MKLQLLSSDVEQAAMVDIASERRRAMQKLYTAAQPLAPTGVQSDRVGMADEHDDDEESLSSHMYAQALDVYTKLLSITTEGDRNGMYYLHSASCLFFLKQYSEAKEIALKASLKPLS